MLLLSRFFLGIAAAEAQRHFYLGVGPMTHEIEWNAAKNEWFCSRCLRTSDLKLRRDATIELRQFKCMPRRGYSKRNLKPTVSPAPRQKVRF